jgi:hypothetical protein
MTELFLFLIVLEGFVLNLLNTTVVGFVAAVLHSSKLLCLLARWISQRDSHGFACAFGFLLENRWN